MRLLVTGGAGFIGSNFVRKCVDGSLPEISSVTVLDKLTYAGNLENLKNVLDKIEFVKGDICDAKLFSKLTSDCDSVVNFAAESHVDRSIESAGDFVDTNIKGVQIMLDVLRQEKASKRFLQISTDEVYGSINNGSWDENSPMLPNSPYAATKASAELLVRSYYRTYKMNLVVTRCSNNYGPRHYPEKLIPLFITNLIENKKVPLYGNGKNIRDWLHVDDHCDAIYTVLTKGIAGEIYNIGGGRELSNNEITSIILNLMNKSDEFIEYVEDRQGHDFRYSVNWTKIEKDLNYAPKVNFEDGIKETIDWYLNNSDWWKPLKDDSKVTGDSGDK
jgi:dTDP-glucose 4,6-dehydratase